MSFRWNVKNVDNYEQLCYETVNGELQWNPVTEALAWGLMVAGIHSITEETWKEVYVRISAYERAVDSFLKEHDPKKGLVSRYITARDVYDHIGMTTNASRRTPAEFWKTAIRGGLEDRANAEIARLEKEIANV